MSYVLTYHKRIMHEGARGSFIIYSYDIGCRLFAQSPESLAESLLARRLVAHSPARSLVVAALCSPGSLAFARSLARSASLGRFDTELLGIIRYDFCMISH